MKKIMSMLILLVFVLVGCSKTSTVTNEYTLPDLTNLTKVQVIDRFQGAPVTTVFKYKISDDIDADLFIEYGNHLKANETVNYGTIVYIYFSQGPEQVETVKLPDLTGKSINEIVLIMNHYDLAVNYNLIDQINSDKLFISYGDNLSVGSDVEVGSTISINISKQYYNLPDLTGKLITEIRSIMSEYNVVIQFQTVESEVVNNDIFVGYNDYAIGDKVYAGVKVIINVSKLIVPGHVQLPDLTGKTKSEITSIFNSLGVSLEFISEASTTVNKDTFIRYEDYDTNEFVPVNSTVYVVVSNSTNYFSPLNLIYDGPRIDAKYTNVNYVNPRGGYFVTTLYTCIDGDTAKFDYPTDIDQIVGAYESVRFLNMDTEESTKLKEEWGKPASNFTCGMLTNAESIIMQTDPDDGLTDTYGRLLGWIWIVPDGTEKKPGETTYTIDQYELLNYKIMQQGLAQVKYLYGAGEIDYNGITYTNWMYQAENYAKTNHLGKWGALLDPYWDYVNNQPKGW